MMRRCTLVLMAAAVLAACSSNHRANPNDAAPPETSTAATEGSSATTDVTSPTSADATAATVGASTPTSAGGSTTPTTSALTVTGTAFAGAVAAVETAEPYAQTDPFAEAVRLADGTCVGWAGSQGGSTASLAVGAPVTVLGAEDNTEIGSGSITASRSEDMAAGGAQWNCLFDFEATLTAPHAEFRIKVGSLSPWLVRPDPSTPGAFTVSVSTNASVALIPECPALPPEPDPTATTAAPTTTLVPPPTTAAPAPVSGWNAVGQYWSTGVRALCSAGLPVTAIARPCRPAGVGSEYITQIVDSSDPTVTYANGTAIPAGTQLTVVVATGHPCA